MKWESMGRLIATIGLIVLLILGAWGIIIIALDAPSFFSGVSNTFSNLFGTSTPRTSTTTPSYSTTGGNASSTEALVLSVASSTVTSGTPFTISWSDQNATGARGYLLAWRCESGITVEAPLPNNTYRSVPCNTGFNYVNAQSHMMLRARLTGSKPVDLGIGIASISLATGSSTARADAMVTVVPAGKPAAPAPSPKVSYKYTVPSSYANNPYGTGDLSVRIISIGYIDPSTGRFIAMPNYSSYNSYPYQTMAVQFDIKNVGTKTAPAGWQFTANLPSNPPYAYASQPERSLTPQSGIVFTLTWSNPNANSYQNNCYQIQTYPYQNYCPPNFNNGFNNGQYNNSYGQGTVSITAEPYSTTADANRSNNTAQMSF